MARKRKKAKKGFISKLLYATPKEKERRRKKFVEAIKRSMEAIRVNPAETSLMDIAEKKAKPSKEFVPVWIERKKLKKVMGK